MRLGRGRGTQVCTPARREYKLLHGVKVSGRRLRRNQQSCFADDFREARRFHGDDRCAARHRFDNGQAETLVQRRINKCKAGSVEERQGPSRPQIPGSARGLRGPTPECAEPATTRSIRLSGDAQWRHVSGQSQQSAVHKLPAGGRNSFGAQSFPLPTRTRQTSDRICEEHSRLAIRLRQSRNRRPGGGINDRYTRRLHMREPFQEPAPRMLGNRRQGGRHGGSHRTTR